MRWWQRVWRLNRLDAQLDAELRFHVEQHTADLIAQGHDPETARRIARLAIGGPEQVKEECRDARGTRWLEDAWQDLRYALRTLRQRPGFAAVAVCTLALGVGATTVMFTVINGVLLTPLAYADPGRLLDLHEQTDWSTRLGNEWAFAYPNYVDLQTDTRTLDVAAFRYAGGTVSASGRAEYVDGFQISSNLFSVLGVPLARGRAFNADEDRPGGAPAAIISYGFWLRRYGGSSSAIGSSLEFDEEPYSVVGVAPAGFQLQADADVFTPLGRRADARLLNRELHPGIQVWARLRRDAALSEARTELALIGRRLAAQYPKSNAGRTFIAQPLRPDVGGVASTLWLLLGAVTLVLLIACANVASLLLARAVSRDRELAMRATLGAGRGRLIRQCLTESAVLGLFGGALGIALAVAGLRPFVTFWPGDLPRVENVHVDWHVLLFALAVSLVSGILFGLAPALRAPAGDVDRVLRGGGRAVRGGSHRLHGIFVVSEVALAVVLLVCAGLLARTLLRLSSLNPGVDVRNVLVARMALPPRILASPAQTRAAWDDVLERARRVPAVQAAAIVDTVPMRTGNNQLAYWTTADVPPPGQQPIALATCVTPDYLGVMGIPLRAGRFFDDRDRIDHQPVVAIDEVLAQTAFGRQDPIGKRLWLPDFGPAPVEIVGVVGHVRHWGLASDDQAHVRAQLYYPFAQLPDRFVRRWSELMSIAVRTTVAPPTVVESLRHALRGTAGDQVLYEVRTLEQLASASLARQRFLVLLFGLFAGVALLLACIGIYGVLAYLTSQRTAEIGVRMALGATAANVMHLILGESLGMIGIGVVAGTCASLAATRVLERLVDGVRGFEPVAFAIMISVLVAAALVATYVPARRAARIDPIRALRSE